MHWTNLLVSVEAKYWVTWLSPNFNEREDEQRKLPCICHFVQWPLTQNQGDRTMESAFPRCRINAVRSAHTRGHVAGTCRGEEFHALFTRRGMLRGYVSWSVHTEGLVAGTCDFVFWLVYFPKCRGDMSHEQFTRGDLVKQPGCNAVLSPRHVPSIQTDLNSGDMSRGQNFVPATRFFMKIERSHDGICPRDMSPRVSRPVQTEGTRGQCCCRRHAWGAWNRSLVLTSWTAMFTVLVCVTQWDTTIRGLYTLFQIGAHSEMNWGELHEGEAWRAKHHSAIILRSSLMSNSSIRGGSTAVLRHDNHPACSKRHWKQSWSSLLRYQVALPSSFLGAHHFGIRCIPLSSAEALFGAARGAGVWGEDMELSSLSPFPSSPPPRYIFSPSGLRPARRPKQSFCGERVYTASDSCNSKPSRLPPPSLRVYEHVLHRRIAPVTGNMCFPPQVTYLSLRAQLHGFRACFDVWQS